MADEDQALLDTEQEAPSAEAVRARPVFQPQDQGQDLAAPVAALAARPIFQPVAARPVFQPAAREKAADQAPSPEAIAVATDIANQYAAQTPAIPREEYGPAPRAYTLPELAARATAEQYGADFAQRAYTPAHEAARQQAEQYAATSAAADQAQQAQASGAAAAADQGQQSFIDHYATAHVNNPVNLASMGADLWKKGLGNFEALFNTARQGVDTDDLMINRAVDQMLPDGSPEDKEAFRRAFIAGSPDQRSQWLEALLPYTHDLDTAALSDALERKSDPALQAAKAQDLADSQARARANLEGDPRLRGTNVGNIISQVAATPAYAAAANPLIAPVGIPLIFGRIFSDTRQQLADQHPDWNDEQLDQVAAETAIINTVGAEATNRIVGAGLGPLLKNIRGNYLARAAVQVPATAAAQAAVGAGTQAATNIAQGRPIGESVVDAALGQGIVGGAAGAIHARVRPPLAPETIAAPEAAAAAAPAPEAAPAPAPAPEVTSGPSGARVRGPEERTMETGAAQAQAAEAAPTVAPSVAEAAPATPPVAEAPVPVEEAPQPAAKAAAVPREAPAEAAPTETVPAKETVSPQSRDIGQRAYELSQQRAQQGLPPDPTADWLQAEREITAPVPAPVSGEEPHVSAIANRYTAERQAAGELGEIAPGQGYATEDLVALGRRMPPETVAQHISNLVNDVGGDPKAQAAAVRYEEARLSEQSRQASRIAEANPADKQAQADAKEAFDNLTDFHNGPVAKLKNNWHAAGMSMQGEIPVDLTTFNGLREQWLRDVGKAPPADAESVLRKTARRVKTAVDAETAAMNNLSAEIDKATAPKLSADQVALNIMERLKNLPCVIR